MGGPTIQYKSRRFVLETAQPGYDETCGALSHPPHLKSIRMSKTARTDAPEPNEVASKKARTLSQDSQEPPSVEAATVQSDKNLRDLLQVKRYESCLLQVEPACHPSPPLCLPPASLLHQLLFGLTWCSPEFPISDQFLLFMARMRPQDLPLGQKGIVTLHRNDTLPHALKVRRIIHLQYDFCLTSPYISLHIHFH